MCCAFVMRYLNAWASFPWGNETEILIKGENNLFAIYFLDESFCILCGKEILVHEMMKDCVTFLTGEMYIFREEEGGEMYNLMQNVEIYSR